ncbi:hypothetical protein CTAYLR_004997 [Chrysophaeum taylorii]|uniref:RIIa domain-containing protein n=1 Tax=Chrysophaeum taylorii TaxID=2483200 RepID=A0AAD7UAQ8_9STRA|nr:hypothetical protein CTAYLR_004997 [Chrysophaeum taylorii]
MSSKYQKNFSLPTDFPATLRELTKEVLRDQPSDINKYAYDYFMAKLQKEQQDLPAESGTLARVEPNQQ